MTILDITRITLNKQKGFTFIVLSQAGMKKDAQERKVFLKEVTGKAKLIKSVQSN